MNISNKVDSSNKEEMNILIQAHPSVTYIFNREQKEAIEALCVQTFSSSPTLRGRGRTAKDGSMVRIYLEIDPNMMTTCVSYATRLSKSNKTLDNAVVLRKVVEFFINSINILNPKP